MLERLDVVHQQDAARLGYVQPLVGVDRRREGGAEAFEQVAGLLCGCRREAVGAVDVEPDVVAADARRGLRCRRRLRSAWCRRWRPRPRGSRRRCGPCRSPARTSLRPCVCARRSESRGRCARRRRGPRRRGAPSSAPRTSSRAPSCDCPDRRGGRPGAHVRARRLVRSGCAIVPPAARRPHALSSNPTNWPTQRIVCASSRSAAPALFATLTSCEAISASARTPISRPEEPMYANHRGRACASERSSTSAAASSAVLGSLGVVGSGRLSSSWVRSSGSGWPGRGVVEAPPGFRDQLCGVLED